MIILYADDGGSCGSGLSYGKTAEDIVGMARRLQENSHGCYVKKNTFVHILWRFVTKYIFGKLRHS